jgi:enterobactin synthetase component D
LRGIGLDVEPAEALEERLWRAICTRREREEVGFATEQLPAGIRIRTIFSAKESLYKCLHPTLAWPVGFHDVEIEFDFERSCFRAVVPPYATPRVGAPDAASQRSTLDQVRGIFTLTPTTLATACWWEPAPK